MSEKKHIHSDGDPCQCESLKDQIQSIKDKALEDCKARNEEAKEKSKSLESKMTKMLIASTVAFTLIGQEAVEKLEPFIGKITALLGGDVSALTAPVPAGGGEAAPSGSDGAKTTRQFQLDTNPKRITLPKADAYTQPSLVQLLPALELLDGNSTILDNKKFTAQSDHSFSVVRLGNLSKLNPEVIDPVGESLPWLPPAEPTPVFSPQAVLAAVPTELPPFRSALQIPVPIEPDTQLAFPQFQFSTVPSAPSSTILLAGIFQTRKR